MRLKDILTFRMGILVQLRSRGERPASPPHSGGAFSAGRFYGNVSAPPGRSPGSDFSHTTSGDVASETRESSEERKREWAERVLLQFRFTRSRHRKKQPSVVTGLVRKKCYATITRARESGVRSTERVLQR